LLGVDILTKSSLVVRDLSLLQEISDCTVGFTVTTVDGQAARIFEPGAAPPGSRLAAVRQLSEAGIPVWVFIAPILPGVGDTEEALAGLFKALKEAGVKEVLADFLNPYPAVVRRMRSIYRRHFANALADLELYLTQREFYLNRTERVLTEISRQYGYQILFV
jgi:DNA repair photolyase